MIRLICGVLTVLSIVGCGKDNNSSATLQQDPAANEAATMDASALTAESAYYMACASCHETGVNGAPLSGDPSAWTDRSSMWQAVLAEHANKGYMSMPAKGGRVELSDWLVIRATEYMMLLTYPERRPE